MDAKAVELHGKAITKAISEKEPSASVLKLLNELNSGLKPTEDLLRSTRIGVTINKLRTHNDPNIAKLANQMVSKWKEEVNKNKKGGARPKAAAAATSSANGNSSPAPPASGTASPAPTKKKHTVPADKRNKKTDNIKYQVTGDDQRDACLGLIYDGLAFMSEELPEDIFSVAKAVEAAAYANAGSNINDGYKSKIRSLFQNLKNKSNPALRKRVYSGDITPKRFVTMTHDEMKSDERRAADEKLEKENMNNAMVAQVEKSISKEFQCGKCRQRQVSYTQAQTRSADEPMTTFCECMNCGNRWKFS
ncbi:unnamed protein product [Periconia digitata]|uniref:Transcription elongation factor n=1 Tax=Periconia digitata TaxID=1303443 RepID=A0A9W4UAX7_9PLEO|nr:unnamed protein product [Periconia digitata]